MAEKLGYSVVEFRKGFIQDVGEIVEPGSVDLVVSNCVLNLVAEDARRETDRWCIQCPEARRSGGISDIVSDAVVAARMTRSCGAVHIAVPTSVRRLPRLVSKSYDSFEEQLGSALRISTFHSATVVAGGSGCC